METVSPLKLAKIDQLHNNLAIQNTAPQLLLGVQAATQQLRPGCTFRLTSPAQSKSRGLFGSPDNEFEYHLQPLAPSEG